MSRRSEKYCFEAEIQTGRSGGAFVAFPYDVEKEFGTNGRVKVKVSFDRIVYRGSLAPVGDGHILGITKDICGKIGKDVGDKVTVIVAEDPYKRIVDMPEEPSREPGNNPQARAESEKLSHTYRKKFAKWITDARKMETRERRLKRAIQKIIDGEKL